MSTATIAEGIVEAANESESDPLGVSGVLTAQAMRRPDAPAVVDVARTWTYAEAATRTGQISAALKGARVGRGDRVGVHCNKGAEGFFAMHAVVSAGAIAVPLDPSSPATRLASICERMQIGVVVSHAPRAKSLASLHELHPLHMVIGLASPVDDLPAIDVVDLERLTPAAPESVKPDDRAYIITTSGSTGEPKGMVHTHSSAMAYAQMTHRTYDMTPDDRVSDIAPHHFDISTHPLWSVPLIGATNVVISEPYQGLPASHSQRLQDETVTFWYSVPFLLQQLVLRGDLENRDLSALRWVHFGGEVISAQIIGEMMRHCPNAKFANIFGPAETNQCSLAVFDSPPQADRPVSVGFPLDHSDILALREDVVSPTREDSVGVGEKGEMWVHTPQLMEGYWNAPDVNADKIRLIDGKRFYRSGDLISFDASGEMSFHGRLDHQVKVRGFRVELEGLELELEQLDGVDNVVASVRRSPVGEDEIIAGVLGVSGDFNDTEFLRSAASVLPAYAVPSYVVVLDGPAFTGSGKLDRRSLRERVITKAKDQSP